LSVFDVAVIIVIAEALKLAAGGASNVAAVTVDPGANDPGPDVIVHVTPGVVVESFVTVAVNDTVCPASIVVGPVA
jgi:hypothetical protein